jgi:hypothetical protein
MFRGRKTYRVNRWSTDSSDPQIALPEDREERPTNESDVVSSETYGGAHMPVLDIDVPHHYEPSTTPGHGHLYLDVAISWPVYRKLLIALEEAGVLEEGYVGASIDRRATFVRLPWVRKGADNGKASASA